MPTNYGIGVGANTTVWTNWIVTTSTSTTSTTSSFAVNNIWTQWLDTGTSSGSVYQYVPPTPPTPEQVEARRVEAALRETNRAAAEAIALAFLREMLTPEQIAELDADRRFEVTGSAGKRYRIRCEGGISGNVECLDEGRPVERLCIHPSGLPASDVYLSQKLLLEADEAAFRKIANVTRLPR